MRPIILWSRDKFLAGCTYGAAGLARLFLTKISEVITIPRAIVKVSAFRTMSCGISGGANAAFSYYVRRETSPVQHHK